MLGFAALIAFLLFMYFCWVPSQYMGVIWFRMLFGIAFFVLLLLATGEVQNLPGR